MSQKFLKPVRVVVSLLVLFLIGGLFSGMAVMPAVRFGSILLYLQVVPSVVDLLTVLSLASAGFFCVVILTFLSGRIYCSSLCPLGTLQDIASGVSRRWHRVSDGSPSGFRYRRATRWVSYPVLGVTGILLLAGNLSLLTLLDPFSLAGRALAGMSDLLTGLPSNPLFFSWHGLRGMGTECSIRNLSFLLPWMISVLLVLGIGLLAVWKGRWYCTVICPVGSLLGIIARWSLFRIRIEPSACRGCGSCVQVCKAGCINQAEKHLDFDRCVACFNCLSTCTDGAVRFRIGRIKKKENGRIDDGRRSFLRTLVWLVPVTVLSGAERLPWISGKAEGSAGFGSRSGPDGGGSAFPATPPGSLSLEHFTDHCTSCHLCVVNCPTGVLRPALMPFGLTGILQPRMDFESGYCRLDCTRCLALCPAGAIRLLPHREKVRIRIGTARLIKNLCIPVADRRSCSLCGKVCPVKAITMKPYLGDLSIPEIDESACNGCGACEYICPTRPVRAMYVEPLEVHSIVTSFQPDFVSNQ